MLVVRKKNIVYSPAFQVISVLIVASLVLSCCSCVNGKKTSTTKTNKITTTTLTGNITLPSGLSTGGQKVVNGLSNASVGVNGQFKLKAVADSRQFTIVESAKGNPMLLGWPDSEHREINAHTTAEVLVYMASGLFLLPSASQTNAMDLLAKSSELDNLEKAITDALTQDPEAFSKPNQMVSQALSVVVDQLTGTTEARGTAMPNANFAILVNPPASSSGLTINMTQGINSVFITNSYRRPGYCFIDRVATYDENGIKTPSPSPLTKFEVKEVGGVNGLTSTLTDIVKGDLAYQDKSTAPVSLPVPEGATKALYRLCVVGPGANEGSFASLSDEEKNKYYEVAGKFLVVDLLLRFVVSFMIPEEKVDEFINFYGATTAFTDILDYVLKNLSQSIDQMNTGHFRDAFKTITDAFISSASFQKMVIQSLIDGIQNAYGIEAASGALEAAQQFLAVLGLVDKILISFDSSVICQNLNASNKADVWDITVNQVKVVLTPDTADLVNGDDVTFVATLPEQSGSGVNLVYKWVNTAVSGHLTDGISGHKDQFDSSSNKATYTCGDGQSPDTVTVEVWALAGSSQSQREYIGEATATVNVEWGPGSVNVTIGHIPGPPAGAAIYSVNIMAKNMVTFLATRWVEDPGFWLGHITVNNLGDTTYNPGHYKIVVYAYDKEGKLLATNSHVAIGFTLRPGQNNVEVWWPVYNEPSVGIMTYDLSGSQDKPTEPKVTGPTGPWGLGVTLNGKGTTRYGSIWSPTGVWFDGKSGDLLECHLTRGIFGDEAPCTDTINIGAMWVFCLLDGEIYKMSDADSFTQFFPNGETMIFNPKFTLPPIKFLPAPPVPPIKTTTTSTTPLTTTMTSTPATSTTTPTSQTTTTSTKTTTTSTTTTTPTTMTTTTQTTSTTTTSLPPGKIPLAQVNVWFTIVNDPNAAHTQNLALGATNVIYLWAQAPVNQEGDFVLLVTTPNSNFQIKRHASNGDVINCGSLTGNFTMVGDINMQAVSGNSTLGNATLHILGEITPIQTVVTNLRENSGELPQGATINNDWWYWDLSLKNPNTIGVTILSGQKHILTPYEENTSPLGKSIVDVFGTDYLPPGGEIMWHNAFAYFTKRSSPYQALRTVTFIGKDDLGRDVTIEYTITVIVD